MPSNLPPKTRPDVPRSLRPGPPLPVPAQGAGPSGEHRRDGSSPSLDGAGDVPPLWLAQLALELRERKGYDDVGVFALHLAHVREIVCQVGAFAAHRALTTTMIELARTVDGRGSCARLGSYDLLVFARTTTKAGSMLELADAMLDQVMAMSFRTAERELTSKPFLGCARWSEGAVDEDALVAKSLRRLERAKVGGRRACVSDR